MSPLMDFQINLQVEVLPTVRAQESLCPGSRKDTGWLSHGLCCLGLPNAHPRHSLDVMPSVASSLNPGPFADSKYGLVRGLQKLPLRFILRQGFCLDGHSAAT